MWPDGQENQRWLNPVKNEGTGTKAIGEQGGKRRGKNSAPEITGDCQPFPQIVCLE